LKRLGCAYLDYYLTSTPEGSDVPLSESIAAMHKLQESGLVRHVGACNVTLTELEQYQRGGGVEVVQNRFSLVDQEQDRDVREYAAASDIALIPYNVMDWVFSPISRRPGVPTSSTRTLRQGRGSLTPTTCSRLRMGAFTLRIEVSQRSKPAGSRTSALAATM
jgi:aryl-alcohol dehydrogenase-like predicted oxidoreductase